MFEIRRERRERTQRAAAAAAVEHSFVDSIRLTQNSTRPNVTRFSKHAIYFKTAQDNAGALVPNAQVPSWTVKEWNVITELFRKSLYE